MQVRDVVQKEARATKSDHGQTALEGLVAVAVSHLRTRAAAVQARIS